MKCKNFLYRLTKVLAVERVCLTTVTYLTVQAAKIPTGYVEHKKSI